MRVGRAFHTVGRALLGAVLLVSIGVLAPSANARGPGRTAKAVMPGFGESASEAGWSKTGLADSIRVGETRYGWRFMLRAMRDDRTGFADRLREHLVHQGYLSRTAAQRLPES